MIRRKNYLSSVVVGLVTGGFAIMAYAGWTNPCGEDVSFGNCGLEACRPRCQLCCQYTGWIPAKTLAQVQFCMTTCSALQATCPDCPPVD